MTALLIMLGAVLGKWLLGLMMVIVGLVLLLIACIGLACILALFTSEITWSLIVMGVIVYALSYGCWKLGDKLWSERHKPAPIAQEWVHHDWA